MKILFLSTSFPRFKDDWVLPSLDVEARELSRCPENEVIVVSSSGQDTKRFELREKVKIYRFNYFFKKQQTLTYTGGLSTSFASGIFSKIKAIPFMISFVFNTLKYGRECDVVHAHWTPSAFAAIPLKILYKKPIIVSLLGADVRLLPKWLNKFIFKYCSAIIASVPIFWVYLNELGVKKDRIHAIKHCYDYDKFNKKDDISGFKKEFNLRNEKIVTFLGRMDPFKDPITFVKSIPYVLNKIKNVKFFIVGYGFLLDDVKKLVKELKLEKHVIITGPRKDANIILEASDIFVNLSPDENYFSVAIQESMAKKTPCLLTNAGDTEKTFTHKLDTYLVPVKNPKATAEGIIEVLKDERLREKIGENGIKLLEKEGYTRERIMNNLNSLYKNVIKN
ncbi:MAG: Glycosyl transferase group 1 [archaeon GW2011_AR20]|nr:MAG: Glycosyl transferase group 1 [archaeon GW2011_AR20]AQS28176.1 hypothetical protein [uncultured archaeon]MBS3160528.1 glycosyltransferase family 4 protein [Candidatus Woesearchaeota archaeon]